MADAAATAEAPAEDAAAAAPAAVPVPEAGKAEKAEKAAKPKRRGKKDAEAGAEAAADGAPSVAAHPRASRSIARAKGWGALLGFLIGGYESLPTHTLAAAGVRAIVFGVVLYVAVWAGSVFFWRRMVMIEIRAREAQLLAAARARHAEPGGARGGGAS